MILYSSNDINFPYKACEKLYNENKKYLSQLDIPFARLIECLLGNFWAVCDDNDKLMGCLYFETRNKKWFISGFSVRGVTVHVTPAIHCLIKHYGKKRVYSETPHRHAKIALLRAGFKKIMYNIYKWEA